MDPILSMPAALEEIARWEADPASEALPAVRVGVLRNATLEGLEPYLKVHLRRAGLRALVQFGGYATSKQDLTRPEFATSEILILSLLPTFLPEGIHWRPESILERLQNQAETALEQGNSLIVLPTLIRPLHPLEFRSAEVDPGSEASRVATVNAGLREFACRYTGRVMLIDTEAILMRRGASACLDLRLHYLAQAPFRSVFWDDFARQVAVFGRTLTGRSKKCLVLDCDNTLWGGIVGEDGLGGIQLDPFTHPGNIYYAFQQRILAFQAQGVIVCLCSKNDEKDVWEVLEQHPHCLIKPHHLSAWRINWESKAQNLDELIHELNIAPESVVFMDDSDLECGLVAEQCHGVTVCQVPRQRSELPAFLAETALFERTGGTREDLQRSTYYQAEAQRKAVANSTQNLEQYLASLEQVISVHRMRENEIARVAQLTQKTNQFNLTTRRVSEAQVRIWASDPSIAVFTLNLRDRFGDSGLTGALIAIREDSSIYIDNLLLSCRILQRNVEQAFVAAVMRHLEEVWDAHRWRAEYLPTPKNGIVQEFWELFGFVPEVHSDGSKSYVCEALVLPETASVKTVLE